MSAKTSQSNHLIFRTEKLGFFSLVGLLFSRKDLTQHDFVESSADTAQELAGTKISYFLILTFFLSFVMRVISVPLRLFGEVLEFFLNFLAINGGILGLLWHLLTVSVKLPKKGTKEYKSSICFTDDRVELYKTSVRSSNDFSPLMSVNLQEALDGVGALDLSMMAAKIVYENKEYIKDVVVNHWKMNFVGFFEGWNKYIKKKDTQSFIFTDKPTDANMIVVAFRGTEPFNAHDWLTDLDVSWLEMGKMGRVHLGFMKALGLQDEKDYTKGFPKNYANSDPDRQLTYYTLRSQLTTLLAKHPKAQILITGHSLGAALAVLFTSVLALHEEKGILSRLFYVLPHAQPRVGNPAFGSYMESIVNPPLKRVTYRYDIVPRIPFDSPPSVDYKHFGSCVYYSSIYNAQMIEEEPNKNYFSLKFMMQMHWCACKDLMRGMFAGVRQGKEFREGWMSIFVRMTSLVFPGLASHAPRDYVNGARLAKISYKDIV